MSECNSCEHDYRIAGKDYFKTTGETNAFGAVMNQMVAYSTIFCSKCGETKEIVSRDYRRVPA